MTGTAWLVLAACFTGWAATVAYILCLMRAASKETRHDRDTDPRR